MKIGILQTGKVPETLEQKHGQYPSMFERLFSGHGFTFENYLVVDGELPPSVHACEGWLITGSAHGAYDPLPWISRLEEFIRDAYRAGVPVAGICFGHQIMAQAFGGKVEKFHGGWGAGTMEYRMSNGDSIRVNAMHQDQVTVRPPDAEIICSSEFCENAGLAYSDLAISFQPHPEFDDAFIEDLVRVRAGKAMPAERAEVALASLGVDKHDALIARRIADFFRQARGKAAA